MGSWSRRGSAPNFGDELAPYLLSVLSRRPVAFSEARADRGPVYLTVGSVLTRAGKNTIVWGSGMLSREHPPPSRFAEILALRGPLSLELIQKKFSLTPSEVAFGDPALLLGLLFPEPAKTKFEFGIIPHYVDEKLVAKALPKRLRKRARVISVSTDNVKAFVDAVKSCKTIISSSLHGLVVANALSRNAAWVSFSDKVMGDGFKFRDYSMAVGLDLQEPFSVQPDSLGSVRGLREISKFASGGNLWANYDPQALIASCPFIDKAVHDQLNLGWETVKRHRG